jgi:serine/threonine protein kinase
MTVPSIEPQTPEQRLDEAIATYLKAVKVGSADSAKTRRQEWLALHPDLADELRAFFADQDRFEHLAAPLRMVLPSAPVISHHPPFTQIGNYELLEEIARGGMGVVYKARQINLNRIVALKMLRAGPQATPADLQRFRTEFEAVAQLDHPNIIPIYEVGDYSGQPFFSMKLVEEGNLATKVKGWAVTAGCPARTGQIATLMLKVAAAVHFAHQRGILHRDLKPANILINSRGEPYVTDFGLAKRINSSSVAVHPSSASITQTGSILGTPAYMAPEQAEPSAIAEKGSRAGVTTAADVYSLGAILYELLAGRPPFHAETTFETVRRLLEEEPDPPRNINPQVPRDLQTICLKCLEKDPGRRYATALALAEDLERFLAGEPIQSRPVGNLERAWRWCRRKPIVSSLATSLVIAVLGGLIVVSRLWRQAEHHRQAAENHWKEAERQWERAETNLAEADRQRQRAENNLQEAQDQRRQAESSFHLAHQAVNDFCMRVDDALVDVPGLQSLRKKILESGLNYYQTFLNQRAHDPKIKEELAAAQFRVGQITSAIGSKEDALAAYEKAQALYLELLHDQPMHIPYLTELAHTHNNKGLLHSEFATIPSRPRFATIWPTPVTAWEARMEMPGDRKRL